ncbi:phosphate/phosphite/phosphonate ABC transporter substrate-binding protein [Pseudoxanthomonas sp. GM95]|uniref:phosphate/phosphite/phosphonate ABC transporter substrate-binding protein n=1 Tax=Pseudoxanthomonas sp. GM95 TaxID=1881043 RepID=UPI000B85507E|nr:phosphate/phosphite/phosphonate ABC transporter substrate-binding protein [Pseudoxanthomonas sp. GM95]
MRIWLVGVLLGFVLSAAPLYAAPPSPGDDDPHVLVLGRISDDPKSHYAQLKPLLDYVVAHMADVGITSGRILMARDARQMSSYLRRSRVDWVTETSGTGMELQRRSGAQPLLLTERGGASIYHSILFTRADSGITSLVDLRGKSVALQGVGSTSAYLMPASTLLGAGLPMEILLSPQDRPDKTSVGYVFARSELNIAAWVDKGMVDAGALSNLDWADPRRMPEAFRKNMRVLAQTGDYPRALEMVRPGLDSAVRDRLRQVLLDAAQDPQAATAMKRFFGTTRFLRLDAPALQALERVREASARVREQIE